MAGGLKINNDRSEFVKKSEEEDKNSFEAKVAQKENAHLDLNARAFTLGSKVLEILKDKTLLSNKGEITKRTEHQTLKELQELSIEMNNVQNGIGSTAMEAILFSVLLKFRDRINDLEFKVTQLNEELNKAPLKTK